MPVLLDKWASEHTHIHALPNDSSTSSPRARLHPAGTPIKPPANTNTAGAQTSTTTTPQPQYSELTQSTLALARVQQRLMQDLESLKGMLNGFNTPDGTDIGKAYEQLSVTLKKTAFPLQLFEQAAATSNWDAPVPPALPPTPTPPPSLLGKRPADSPWPVDPSTVFSTPPTASPPASLPRGFRFVLPSTPFTAQVEAANTVVDFSMHPSVTNRFQNPHLGSASSPSAAADAQGYAGSAGEDGFTTEPPSAKRAATGQYKNRSTKPAHDAGRCSCGGGAAGSHTHADTLGRIPLGPPPASTSPTRKSAGAGSGLFSNITTQAAAAAAAGSVPIKTLAQTQQRVLDVYQSLLEQELRSALVAQSAAGVKTGQQGGGGGPETDVEALAKATVEGIMIPCRLLHTANTMVSHHAHSRYSQEETFTGMRTSWAGFLPDNQWVEVERFATGRDGAKGFGVNRSLGSGVVWCERRVGGERWRVGGYYVLGNGVVVLGGGRVKRRKGTLGVSVLLEGSVCCGVLPDTSRPGDFLPVVALAAPASSGSDVSNPRIVPLHFYKKGTRIGMHLVLDEGSWLDSEGVIHGPFEYNARRFDSTHVIHPDGCFGAVVGGVRPSDYDDVRAISSRRYVEVCLEASLRDSVPAAPKSGKNGTPAGAGKKKPTEVAYGPYNCSCFGYLSTILPSYTSRALRIPARSLHPQAVAADKVDSMDEERRCSYCGAVFGRDEAKVCGKCRNAKYCSRECQVEGWKGEWGHKKTCKPIPNPAAQS
ncbi:hypothetical protein M427DRAFT_69278 [Gonapodya prolifera JEL478]|uniref:MYND-type domain-containing protein n=1 Tax=Gonapodya prolifera (strain JEL478) TaxID=1344416 RepID=A0A139AHV7_GONPJ|nr:hypothetical protein M427DRAFT_69278 [Gonapodya prolifera JEL478]|eukprot:KXS16318.1 hypothetical protein M427DRAFT_69278 [Gonapodya prolifera JEL478]